MSAQTLMSKLNLNDHSKHSDSPDFDMPLPPPPIELQDFSHPLPPPSPPVIQQHQTLNSQNMLPPPPPLPPLVESDTASTSSSISINNMSANTSNAKLASNNDDTKSARNCYLDDINQRRFQLKSSKKETNGNGNNSSNNPNGSMNASENKGNETIQPFVNNSDVAAIIDFIRKYRPHVRDSSDEDEENSDWDD
jgi:hypothetical protein